MLKLSLQEQTQYKREREHYTMQSNLEKQNKDVPLSQTIKNIVSKLK